MSVEVRGLEVTLGGTTVLGGIDLSVDDGDWLVVVGPNGAGKSTLLHAMLGWQAATRGTVRMGGVDLGALSGSERAAQVGWLPQHPRVAEPLPVVEVVASARFRFTEGLAARHAAARGALSEVGATSLAERQWSTLSGGESQRVALAALVAQQARVWLLDEPANHLDPAVQHRVHRFLAQRWRDGQTLLSVTHDLNRVLAVVGSTAAVTVAGLVQGELRFCCGLDHPDLQDRLAALYGVRVHRVALGDGWRLLFEGGS